MKLSVVHRSAPKEGELECGDVVVRREEGERTLLAVIDALGHGPRAAEAARAAVDALAAEPLAAGPIALIQHMHKKLRGTRGCAALVLVIDAARLEGCGVGNVEMRTHGVPVPAVLTPGVIGTSVRALRGFGASITDRRGRLVMFTDGISSRFDLQEFRALSTEQTCNALFERYRRSHDDASIMVVDFEGSS